MVALIFSNSLKVGGVYAMQLFKCSLEFFLWREMPTNDPAVIVWEPTQTQGPLIPTPSSGVVLELGYRFSDLQKS